MLLLFILQAATQRKVSWFISLRQPPGANLPTLLVKVLASSNSRNKLGPQ
jgi:hypothetical protein